MALRIISWNVNQRDDAWHVLAADALLDVALLQEAKPPAVGVAHDVHPERSSSWTMPGYKRTFRTAVAAFSDRVTLRPRRTRSPNAVGRELVPESREGSLAIADVLLAGGEVFTVISAYAVWENVVSNADRPWIISDAAAHRIISDLSALITSPSGHKLIVAGDFNLMRGYGENGSEYWARRYATVFTRMEALGLRCVGPQAPNGRQADPWPAELPKDSKNVPTYHSSHQRPATAARQLDYVFASEGIADRIRVRALNGLEEWGPSDHCRIEIVVDDALDPGAS